VEFYNEGIGYNKAHSLIGCLFTFKSFSIVICYETDGELESINVIEIDKENLETIKD